MRKIDDNQVHDIFYQGIYDTLKEEPYANKIEIIR